MKRILRFCAALMATATIAQPATAQPAPGDGGEARTTAKDTSRPARWRVEAGYQYKHVYSVPMHMGDLGVSAGFPAPKIGGVVYIGLHQGLGRTEYGLTVWETSARALIDFPFDRLHLGLEPHWSVLGVRRRSKNGTMHALNLGGALVLGVDVVRTAEQSALQIVARGGVELLGGTGGGTEGESATPLAPWCALSVAYDF